MFGIHRTTATAFGRRAARAPANSRPSHHRRRRDWRVEYLEGRTLLSHFDVLNLNDSGAGSLRRAIELSNSTSGPNEIDFSAGLSGTITLTSGELMIANRDVSIVGPGQNLLTVSGNGNSRVFEIASGVSVSLSRVTITGGKADKGGGIYSAGTLTLDSCTVVSNETTPVGWGGDGGGIYNLGTITVNNSHISGNSTAFWGNGGGISNPSGTVTVNNSDISGNSANGIGGGGISNGSGTVTVNNSDISGNRSYVQAGGIFNDSGTVTINATSICGNEAWGGRYGTYGGGIYNSGTMMIETSTISGNSAQDAFGSHGGGVCNFGTMAIDASTISGNSARDGGGIYSSGRFYYDEVQIRT
jgi:hypothetical protein